MKVFLFLLLALFFTNLKADYKSNISTISSEVETRMIKGNSWKRSCPIKLEDLRYVSLSYWDFEGNSKVGELIVHKSVANSITSIFNELYKIQYPVFKMQLVSDYGANDWNSIEAGNTSAFNCRKVTGRSDKWSNHTYGRAIDINPIQNPYISKKGHISHKSSLQYRKRVHIDKSKSSHRAILLKNDKATLIFKKYGWKWGGDWRTIKDYQHFEKKQ